MVNGGNPFFKSFPDKSWEAQIDHVDGPFTFVTFYHYHFPQVHYYDQQDNILYHTTSLEKGREERKKKKRDERNNDNSK